jgi:hypothetical protein
MTGLGIGRVEASSTTKNEIVRLSVSHFVQLQENINTSKNDEYLFTLYFVNYDVQKYASS